MKSCGITVDFTEHRFQFREKSVGQFASALALVIIQDLSQIVLDKSVEVEPHRLTPKILLQNRPIETRRCIGVQLGIAS